ncbi:hypothetical protein BGL34_01695 [Fructilactobacillus lindneri]|uniref:Uncharacterized protein n=2 Tax=Fructilactobacillus lindneri TaxID=53444 RepID=A0A0R2JPA8_9LACO|nr:hypothetical protein [Fructilactobacillus lindneri]ANZ58118.1 hypothetical protein AYR60_04890 [Fructilactobacillus lindneri]ANZ59439.1 hypothetical protein AYR59_05145 [Fructilactobacillus lindneri]KRN78936.1 hypothetical protein IV52_GL000340 [Fructilactobacillus lindneri DSM 20690 = JCM 11027]POG98777.1 hypothetical protein BGL31_02285 [Fructilactobacillus lindneri]POH03050.1 hypothetical protein BGL33_03720 [Fructilactobacillus lindneri]
MLVNVPFEIDADGIHDLKKIKVTLPSGEIAELGAATLDDINRDHEHLLTIIKDENHELGSVGESISFDNFGEKNSFPDNKEVVFMAIPK